MIFPSCLRSAENSTFPGRDRHLLLLLCSDLHVCSLCGSQDDMCVHHFPHVFVEFHCWVSVCWSYSGFGHVGVLSHQGKEHSIGRTAVGYSLHQVRQFSVFLYVILCQGCEICSYLIFSLCPSACLSVLSACLSHTCTHMRFDDIIVWHFFPISLTVKRGNFHEDNSRKLKKFCSR